MSSADIPPNPYEGDPDFAFLQVERPKLVEIQSRPFDGKKNVWIPDDKEGFLRAEILATKGDEVTVLTEVMAETTVKKECCQQMNPPKFELIPDMANMTFLNEASVLNNLRQRYYHSLIYTYSGLFCVVINPYRRLPIYSQNVINKYQGKRKTEMPPHLFSVADNAYRNMLQDRENQSILVTGESGAGKTENTKKVISYFANVAASSKSDKEAEATLRKGGTLEDAIIQANPVMEAFGNAKTMRNNNSSRFGKFIRIHFGTKGKIAGADIETYLLEKSRVTYQQPGKERNYHIYYWLLSGRFPEHTDMMLCDADPALYHFINQGCLTVDNMDDKDEMKFVDRAFEILDIPNDERDGLYRCVGAVLHFGEMKFKQRPREEQAEADGTAEAEKVAHLLGVNASDLLKSLLKPRVKVGSEYVTRGQNKDQVYFAVNALAKCIYDRMFKWLVARVNKTLETKNKRQFFIGVLDIAGFEIFELNTFEQLCINYTNERLQQFFNHHMFVLEQEEYKKEGIHWEFIDFGMDLQACIDLIEKPMGILSILEEECMFPKANDKTLLAKLYENHHGKSEQFGKPKPDKRAKHEAHFEIYHYAGTVQYNIFGWLNKNKDPINETVLQLLGSSKEPLVSIFFEIAPEAEGGRSAQMGKKKKGSSYHTISATHKEQLAKLMATLKCTAPHFVRCIIPNEVKQPGLIDAKLVLHQLQCNGVLEGIRICRKGFPNRLIYSEFKQRYSILAPNVIPLGFVDGKIVTEKVLNALELDPNEYRLGHTKVFFRAGVLGHLEEIRDEKLTTIISNFQAYIRGYHMRVDYKVLRNKRIGLSLIQRNIRKWLTLRNWQWWRLYTRVKPLLNMARQEDELNKMKEEFEKTKVELAKVSVQKTALEEHNVTLLQSKNDMFLQLQAEQDQLADAEERITQLVTQKADHEQQIKEFNDRVNEYEAEVENLEVAKKKMEEQGEAMKADIQGLELNLQKVESEKVARENQIKTLNDEMTRQDDVIARLTKEKKTVEENNRKMAEELQAEEDKVNHLNKIKQKQEHAIDELEDNLEREKKNRADVEKSKRKVESELKQTLENVEDLERIKRELEEALRRKEAENKSLEARLEDQENLIAQLRRKIKELQARIEELEEELEAERAARAKSEKLRAELQRELDELSERLDEAGGATQAQVELNKKREAELQKMRRDLEEAQVQSEQTISALKKKQQDAVNELSEQVEQLNKAKSKAEKESTMLKAEIDDIASQMNHVTKTKGTAEKQAKQLDTQLIDMKAKVEESTKQIADFTTVKAKLEHENSEVTRQLEEAESEASSLTKAKNQLQKQLEEAKAQLEEESRMRQKLQNENRNMKSDLQAAQDQLEEEAEGRAELQKQVTKASGEAQEWRRRMESGEGGVRSEELDDLKRKLNAKLAEAENELDNARSKIAQLEKAKHRLSGDLEDVTIEMERAQAIANQAEKRQRAFDKTIDEWKRKVTDLQNELDNALKDGRGTAAEVYKLRAQIDEGNESIEALRRENKHLNEEIHELTDQLGEGGKGVHELEKAKRRLQIEKEELQGALEEAEAALEQEEVKGQRAQLEIAAIKQEIDRRLAEKDEEFENTRRNHQRIVESMQASLEAETRGKNDAVRAKKKLEQDINELEVQLDAANRARADAEKNYKKSQLLVQELQSALEEEKRHHQDARELYGNAERRANSLSAELEELRTQLESAERARKMAESELNEAHDRVSELSSAQASLAAVKRKLENDVHAMQSDLDDQANQLHDSEEALKKAITDAAQAAEELRQEQEHSGKIEKLRRALEGQVKELQARLDEADANSLKGGKRIIQKLEARVRELEAELEGEQRRHIETQKNFRKQDRKLKEFMFQADEDKKQIEKARELTDKFQQKIKVYKRQVEEAEEIAAVNLAKYRKVQHELEDAEERADIAENTLSKLRAKNRSSLSSTRSITNGPGGRASSVTTPRRSMSISKPE